MNINQRITELGSGGLPRYNNKCNELTRAVNWLLGLRTSGGNPISDGGRGPIIPGGTITTPTTSPWATDPDGNAAGWSLITCLNLQTNQSFQTWIWTGQVAKNIQNIPWMFDPSTAPANWVVCAQNTFWGTGSCPAGGAGNFQQIGFTANGASDSGINPYILTGNVSNSPIVPPTNPPAFYLIADDAGNDQAGQPHQPYLSIVTGIESADVSLTCSFTWTITYDGTTVFSISGSETITWPNSQIFFLIDPSAWIYNPGGLIGYSQGSKKWIWQYQGAISANTNPTFVETFSYSCSRLAQVQLWNVTVLTQ